MIANADRTRGLTATEVDRLLGSVSVYRFMERLGYHYEVESDSYFPLSAQKPERGMSEYPIPYINGAQWFADIRREGEMRPVPALTLEDRADLLREIDVLRAELEALKRPFIDPGMA